MAVQHEYYFRSVAEMAAEPLPEPPVLIPGLVRTEDSLVVGGPTGVGKSLWLWQLAWCLVRGTPFLGVPIPTQHRVMVVQGELGRWSAENRFLEQARQLGVSEYDVPLWLHGERGWNWDRGLRELELKLDRTQADVLMLDPFVAIKPNKVHENNNDEVGSFLYGELGPFQEKHGLSLIVISHHFGKKPIDISGGERDPIEMFRGASAWGGWARAGIALTRLPGSNLRRMQVAKVGDFREGEFEPEMKLKIEGKIIVRVEGPENRFLRRAE